MGTTTSNDDGYRYFPVVDGNGMEIKATPEILVEKYEKGVERKVAG
jgi:hypothetical protein